MPLYFNHNDFSALLNHQPKRIISLVPSQTELLYDLGLENEVVGITKFCVHPHNWFVEKQRIGGTKNPNLSKIRSLQPDLIIANKEENIKADIDELANEFPVWLTDVNTIDNAYQMIEDIGTITSKIEEAKAIIEKIKSSFTKLQTLNSKPKTAYLIWKNPYMTVGGNTFISNMLNAAGFNNIFQNLHRYPEISLDDLQIADCELLFLSSEPYPFKEKHIAELKAHLPNTKIMLVDGEMFSWYGSRMLHAATYFKKLHTGIAG